MKRFAAVLALVLVTGCGILEPKETVTVTLQGQDGSVLIAPLYIAIYEGDVQLASGRSTVSIEVPSDVCRWLNARVGVGTRTDRFVVPINRCGRFVVEVDFGNDTARLVPG